MFEVFDMIVGKSEREQESLLLRAFDEVKGLRAFMQDLHCGMDDVVDKRKVFKMLQYYGLTTAKSLRDVRDVSEYVKVLCIVLNAKEKRVKVDSVDYVADIWRKLKKDVRNIHQYELLYKLMLFLKPDDVKWAIRFYCKEDRYMEILDKVIVCQSI